MFNNPISEFADSIPRNYEYLMQKYPVLATAAEAVHEWFYSLLGKIQVDEQDESRSGPCAHS
jgi:hypothetical protein